MTLRSPTERRALRARLCEAQGHRCAYCGVRFGAAFRHWTAELTAATIDRVIPGSRGGIYVLENCVAACLRCNRRRGDEDALAFFEREGWWTAKDRKLGLDFLRSAIRKSQPMPSWYIRRKRWKREAKDWAQMVWEGHRAMSEVPGYLHKRVARIVNARLGE